MTHWILHARPCFEFGEIDSETRAAVLGAADAVGGPRADRRTRAPTQREMASLYSEQRDKGPGYILDTNWKIFSTARERQRAMLEAGWIPMCATGGAGHVLLAASSYAI